MEQFENLTIESGKILSHSNYEFSQRRDDEWT